MSALLILAPITSVGAYEFNELTMSQEEIINATPAEEPSQEMIQIMSRSSNYNKYTIPGKKGTLTSNVWRSKQKTSGNTLQWNYQVSAVYSGSQ